MKRILFSTGLVISSVVWSHSIAATFTLNPSIDAFVTTGPGGSLSSSNYGGAGTLVVSAPGMSKGEFQSALQFDISGAKASFDSQFGVGGWALQSVTLQLTAAQPNNPIYNNPSAAGLLGISWLPNDSWTEGTGNPGAPGSTGITFNILQGLLSGSDENLGMFAFSGATNGASVYTLGLTSGFVTDMMGGNNVTLRLFAGDSSISGIFNSKNFGTAASRPLLTLTAVPEPGMAMMGAGFLAMWAIRRVRARR